MWNYGLCRAPGLPQSEESELLTASDGIDAEEEQEAEPDLDVLNGELEAMKQRLLVLRNRLVRPEISCLAVCDAAVKREDESFMTQDQRTLIALRRSNCAMRCQVQGLVQQLHERKRSLKELEEQRCLVAERQRKMRQQLDILAEFKASLQHHFALCIERWEQMKTSKVDVIKFEETMSTLMKHIKGLSNDLVPVQCHHITRSYFNSELYLMRLFMKALYESLLDHYKYFQRRLSTKTQQSIWSLLKPETVRLTTLLPTIESPPPSPVGSIFLFRE